MRNAGNVPHAKLVICGCMYMAFVWRDFRVDLDFTFKGMKLLHLCKPFVEQQDAYAFNLLVCTAHVCECMHTCLIHMAYVRLL